jgi:hypothetical protein
VATVQCTLAFINDDGDKKATMVLEVIERINAELRAQHKSAALVAAQESSPPALRVTTTAQTQEEAQALLDTLIADVEAQLNDSPLNGRKSSADKSLILKLFRDNPERDYTAREVAEVLGKKPHNISAVMQSLVQQGVLKPTKKRPRGRYGIAPMAFQQA